LRIYHHNPTDALQKDVSKAGGAGLLFLQYGDSISKALATIYPTHKWQVWMFERVPVGFWNAKHNRAAYFDWLGSHLGFESRERWYSVSQSIIHANHGSRSHSL
jgi:hypothetical protein